jgi:hypothetical protein
MVISPFPRNKSSNRGAKNIYHSISISYIFLDVMKRGKRQFFTATREAISRIGSNIARYGSRRRAWRKPDNLLRFGIQPRQPVAKTH